MKIAFFTHQYFPHHVGGTEVYLRGLARRAVAKGHEVLIFTYCESNSNKIADFGVRRIEVDGIPVIEIHYNLGAAPNPARYEYNNPYIGKIVRRELENFSPHLVHAMHTMKLSVSVVEAATSLDIPVITTLCDFWYICPRHTLLKWNGTLCEGPKHAFSCVKCLQNTHRFAGPDLLNLRKVFTRSYRRQLKFVARDLIAIPGRQNYLKPVVLGSRRIIALSAFQKRIFVQNGYPDNRIEVCEHGLETDDLISGKQARDGSLRLGFIGSLVEHKGAHVLVEALRRIPELNVKCFIHGPIKENDDYTKQLLATAEKDKRIYFKGGFEPHRLGDVLQEFEILVMPALWYENEPLVIKAALHLGVPVIASNIGSLSEMLQNGRRGILVKAGDANELAKALSTAVHEFQEGKGHAAPMKTMNDHAEEIFTIYQQEGKQNL